MTRTELFWANAEKNAAEVRDWPKWEKQGIRPRVWETESERDMGTNPQNRAAFARRVSNAGKGEGEMIEEAPIELEARQ